VRIWFCRHRLLWLCLAARQAHGASAHVDAPPLPLRRWRRFRGAAGVAPGICHHRLRRDRRSWCHRWHIAHLAVVPVGGCAGGVGYRARRCIRPQPSAATGMMAYNTPLPASAGVGLHWRSRRRIRQQLALESPLAALTACPFVPRQTPDTSMSTTPYQKATPDFNPGVTVQANTPWLVSGATTTRAGIPWLIRCVSLWTIALAAGNVGGTDDTIVCGGKQFAPHNDGVRRQPRPSHYG